MVSALNGRIFHFVSVYGHKAPPGVQRRSLHIVLTTYTFQIFTITQATNTYDTLYFMSKTIEEKVYTLKHPELNWAPTEEELKTRVQKQFKITIEKFYFLNNYNISVFFP